MLDDGINSLAYFHKDILKHYRSKNFKFFFFTDITNGKKSLRFC